VHAGRNTNDQHQQLVCNLNTDNTSNKNWMETSVICPFAVTTGTDETAGQQECRKRDVRRVQVHGTCAELMVLWAPVAILVTFQGAKDPLQLPASPFCPRFSTPLLFLGLKYTRLRWIVCLYPRKDKTRLLVTGWSEPSPQFTLIYILATNFTNISLNVILPYYFPALRNVTFWGYPGAIPYCLLVYFVLATQSAHGVTLLFTVITVASSLCKLMCGSLHNEVRGSVVVGALYLNPKSCRFETLWSNSIV
jgi:hypothetical protein